MDVCRSTTCPDCREHITDEKRIYLSIPNEDVTDGPIDDTILAATISGLEARVSHYGQQIDQMLKQKAYDDTKMYVLEIQKEKLEMDLSESEKMRDANNLKYVKVLKDLDILITLNSQQAHHIYRLESVIAKMNQMIPDVSDAFACIKRKKSNKTVIADNPIPAMERRVTRSMSKRKKC